MKKKNANNNKTGGRGVSSDTRPGFPTYILQYHYVIRRDVVICVQNFYDISGHTYEYTHI